MNPIKFWVRPVTICAVLGVIFGFVDTAKTMVSDGKVIESVSVGQWTVHVLFAVLAGIVFGAVIELVMPFVHRL